MKSGLLAFGALISAAPVFAQPQPDPLAPLPAPAPATPAAKPPSKSTATVTYAPLPPSPAPTVAVPTDWRGVFDAIDSGNWDSAQAGIAALPRSVLTPVAKAELYTAKGSPVVDLGSLQALIAEAPELPEADQLAAMAVKRGALTPPPIIAEKPTSSIGSAPYRYKAKPIQGEPYADELRALLDPLVKADDAAGGECYSLLAGQPSVSRRPPRGRSLTATTPTGASPAPPPARRCCSSHRSPSAQPIPRCPISGRGSSTSCRTGSLGNALQ